MDIKVLVAAHKKYRMPEDAIICRPLVDRWEKVFLWRYTDECNVCIG